MKRSGSSDKSAAREMIIFLIGEQEFCIDVMSVRELRAWSPATPLAHAPHFVRGVINLRGMVLPIIDLAVQLGLESTEPTSRHAILVVEIGQNTVGLLVEGVSEILTIQSEQIQPTPNVASHMSKEFLSGLVTIDARIISLVEPRALIPDSEQFAA